jgi:uncharacterized membrane protein YtjA (UPF0391 family)
MQMFYLVRAIKRRIKSLIMAAILSALGFGGVRGYACPLAQAAAALPPSATIAAT